MAAVTLRRLVVNVPPDEQLEVSYGFINALKIRVFSADGTRFLIIKPAGLFSGNGLIGNASGSICGSLATKRTVLPSLYGSISGREFSLKCPQGDTSAGSRTYLYRWLFDGREIDFFTVILEGVSPVEINYINFPEPLDWEELSLSVALSGFVALKLDR
jgi:hypothetical protein